LTIKILLLELKSNKKQHSLINETKTWEKNPTSKNYDDKLRVERSNKIPKIKIVTIGDKMKNTKTVTVLKEKKISNVKVSKAQKKIIGQKSHWEFKADKLILQSIKIFADNTLRADTVELNKKSIQSIVKSIKKNDVETFRAKFYYLAKQDKLKIDGKSQTLGLCSHARARQHVFNQIAQAFERIDLIVEYGKEKQVA